jgi:hypothetical protein
MILVEPVAMFWILLEPSPGFRWGDLSNLSGETNTEIGGTKKTRKTHLAAMSSW